LRNALEEVTACWPRDLKREKEREIFRKREIMKKRTSAVAGVARNQGPIAICRIRRHLTLTIGRAQRLHEAERKGKGRR